MPQRRRSLSLKPSMAEMLSLYTFPKNEAILNPQSITMEGIYSSLWTVNLCVEGRECAANLRISALTETVSEDVA